MRDGRFREDLYYRVNAFAIRLPSLRERQVDIPVLGQRFLARYCAAQGMPLDSKASRKRRSICWSATIGPAISASSKAPCRARRCRRRDGLIRGTDIEFLHATDADGADRRRSDAVAAEAERATSCACSKRCSGTRKRLRGCWTSAAARCTGKLRISARTQARPAGRRGREAETASSVGR